MRGSSGHRLAGDDDTIESGGPVTGSERVSGMGTLRAGRRGRAQTLFDLLPGATVVLDEPDALTEAQDAWWTKLTEAHERSLIGNLVRPEDLYLSPEQWRGGAATVADSRIRATRHRRTQTKASTS